MDVAVIGGTGEEGFGLALRLGRAGHHVIIGSRSAEKGAGAAHQATELLGAGSSIGGTTNEEAASSAEVVAVTVPFAGQADIYRAIKSSIPPGTIVLDATSPLATAVGGKAWQVVRPWHGSAAEQAKAILTQGVRMVAGFHTIAGDALQNLEVPLESDVLVCGDDAEAKAVIGSLVEGIPNLRWVDCGALSMARIAETMTALLVSVNRTYRVRDAGFRIVGRDEWGSPSPSS
ncbi:MAG: NADPH-dependent F420 reductase [Actinomycetota bacterium]|nr:NADPH-dependent F420 reductase [Actinomycetota bacterium]